MAFLPSEYSVILMVMFSRDNCTHFIKNDTFTNECNTMSAGSMDLCCQDLVLDLFGDMKLNQCYQDSSYRNYTQLQFECINPPIYNKKTFQILGLIFILCGILVLVYCIVKWTEEVNESKLQKKKEETDSITSLNQSYNIQDAKYNTFSTPN